MSWHRRLWRIIRALGLLLLQRFCKSRELRVLAFLVLVVLAGCAAPACSIPEIVPGDLCPGCGENE